MAGGTGCAREPIDRPRTALQPNRARRRYAMEFGISSKVDFPRLTRRSLGAARLTARCVAPLARPGASTMDAPMLVPATDSTRHAPPSCHYGSNDDEDRVGDRARRIQAWAALSRRSQSWSSGSHGIATADSIRPTDPRPRRSARCDRPRSPAGCGPVPCTCGTVAHVSVAQAGPDHASDGSSRCCDSTVEAPHRYVLDDVLAAR